MEGEALPLRAPLGGIGEAAQYPVVDRPVRIRNFFFCAPHTPTHTTSPHLLFEFPHALLAPLNSFGVSTAVCDILIDSKLHETPRSDHRQPRYDPNM